MNRARIIEIERTGAVDEQRLLRVLARQDPSWRSMTFEVADGIAVLGGAGLFVNQCLAAGLTEPLTDNEIDHVEQHADELGVAPAFEVCDATREDVMARLDERGYVPDGRRSVVMHDLTRRPTVSPDIEVGLVAAEELPIWLATSAAGWGHETEQGRAANDAYGTAALTADEPGLVLARANDDGRVVGCAALRMTNGVATLGGMSTLPEERGRGVQSTLIGWRLAYAADHGCRYAVSMAAPGSGSSRNLGRLGFVPSHTKVELVRPR